MSTKDVIKSKIIENLSRGAVSTESVIVTLLISILLGLYIFIIYKNSRKKAFYSKDMAITLAALPVIIATIMIAMQSSLIVSLGMVGSLSIIRFRNALKNALDLTFVFWAVSVGIVNGVGLKILASLLCVAMTLLIFFIQALPNSKAASVIVIRASKETDCDKVNSAINKYSKNAKQKSKVVSKSNLEIIYELNPVNENDLLQELDKVEGIIEVSLLSHDGEYRI